MTPAITPPIVVATGEDCAFHRTAADAVRSGPTPAAKIFDATGRRLAIDGAGLRHLPGGDGADELAELLSAWLRRMDALRESTANWQLPLLVQASVDHLGYG